MRTKLNPNDQQLMNNIVYVITTQKKRLRCIWKNEGVNGTFGNHVKKNRRKIEHSH